MSKHGEQHSLSNFVHSPPVLNAHWDPRPIDYSGDDGGFELKSYLNTLYRRPTMPMTALRS
jgi:hypothetical protein